MGAVLRGAGAVVTDIDGRVEAAAALAALIGDKAARAGVGAVVIAVGGRGLVVADVHGGIEVVAARSGGPARTSLGVGAVGQGVVTGAPLGGGTGAVAVGDREAVLSAQRGGCRV